MANLQLIVERLISGKGVVKLPKQDDAAAIRYLILYADVARDPINRYLNYNYNPPKGRYATLTFLRNGYVVDERTLDYEQQSWDGVQDISGQTLIALKCAYEGILQSFINLGLALGATPVSVTDLIKDYENLYLSWDEIRIKCYADTAVRFRLYIKKYDTCSPDKDKQDKPPPPPPPPPKVPPGTPLEVDPPYDGGSNDGGNTEPYTGDTQPYVPPPLPDNTRLKWNLSTNRLPRTTYNDAPFVTFTPVSGYSLTQGNTDVPGNAREWLSTFVSGTTTVNGSAVGNLDPEDKPSLYLWIEGQTDAPWQVIPPP